MGKFQNISGTLTGRKFEVKRATCDNYRLTKSQYDSILHLAFNNLEEIYGFRKLNKLHGIFIFFYFKKKKRLVNISFDG